MHHNRPAQDAFGPDQLDEVIGYGAFSVALRVRFEVSEVANVALRVGGCAVRLGVRIDCGVRGLAWGFGGAKRGGEGFFWGKAAETYNEVPHSYSRWYYPQIDEHACPARRRNHCR